VVTFEIQHSLFASSAQRASQKSTESEEQGFKDLESKIKTFVTFLRVQYLGQRLHFTNSARCNNPMGTNGALKGPDPAWLLSAYVSWN
jgi:hypothetical protein